jgi:hypothetical protein
MISLLHPSRGRADKADDTYQKWVFQVVTHVEYLQAVDADDPEIQKYINHSLTRPFELLIGFSKSVVEATNDAAKKSTGDILVYLSDDFDCPSGWDMSLLREFEGVTKPTLLKVDDCLQDFKVGVVTIPIMNRALYNLLGYFWHPEYKSMHVDVDLYETCKKIGAIKYAPHLKFPHNHYSNGKAPRDETYTRSEANWNQGLEVINRRRRQGFPL